MNNLNEVEFSNLVESETQNLENDSISNSQILTTNECCNSMTTTPLALII